MPAGQYTRKTDYVLFNADEQPMVIIEAKSLRVGIKNRPAGIENQLASYCKGLNRGAAVLTNGVIWHLYELDSSRRTFKNKHVTEVDIREGHGSIIGSAKTLHEWLNKDRWW